MLWIYSRQSQPNQKVAREIQHKLEKVLLEIEKLNIKVEKTELEVKYWRENYEKTTIND
jgi:hypothetical protein